MDIELSLGGPEMASWVLSVLCFVLFFCFFFLEEITAFNQQSWFFLDVMQGQVKPPSLRCNGEIDSIFFNDSVPLSQSFISAFVISKIKKKKKKIRNLSKNTSTEKKK